GILSGETKTLRDEGDKDAELLTVTFLNQRAAFDFKTVDCVVGENVGFHLALLQFGILRDAVANNPHYLDWQELDALAVVGLLFEEEIAKVGENGLSHFSMKQITSDFEHSLTVLRGFPFDFAQKNILCLVFKLQGVRTHLIR